MGILGRVKGAFRKTAKGKRKGRWVVWVHPKRGGKGDYYGGDDYMYTYPSKQAALAGATTLRASKHYHKVETPSLTYK